MFTIESKPRPSCGQIQEHLGDIGVTAGWDLEAKIDFELNRSSQPSQRAQVRHKFYTDGANHSYEHELMISGSGARCSSERLRYTDACYKDADSNLYTL